MNLNYMTVKLVKEKAVRYEAADGKNIAAPGSVYEIATDILELHEKAEEEFWIICLNTKNKIVGMHMVSRGSLNSSVVHPREVFKRALLNNACSMILLHNHPSGNPAPSQTDIDITRRLRDCGEMMGITVLDHIIVGEGYKSIRELGQI